MAQPIAKIFVKPNMIIRAESQRVLLVFEASTNTIEENENRIALENDFYQLRFSLVAGRALSRQERIAGWRAAAR